MEILKQINEIGKGEIFTYGLLTTVIVAAFYIVVAIILKKLITKVIEKRVSINTKVIIRVVKIIIYIIAGYGCLSLLDPFDSVLSKIWGSAGIIALALSLVAQESLGNLVNGLLITTFKPFKIGDLIRVNNGEYEGYVTDISFRDTVITTYENTHIIIPNSLMNKVTLENISSHENVKGNFLYIDIAFHSDMDRAIEIICEEIMKHEKFKDIRTDDEKKKGESPVPVYVLDIRGGSVKIRATVYSDNNSEGFVMMSDIRIAVKKRFEKEGIEPAQPFIRTY